MASGGTISKTRNQPSAQIRVTPLRIPHISVVPQTHLIRSYVFNPFAVNVAQKKAAGEYQDMMAAEGDYTGSLSMTFRAGEVELSLDYGSISIGADLGDYHYVGGIKARQIMRI